MREELRVWLEARGLDIELAVRMGWTTVAQEGRLWLAIPFIRGGKIVTTQLRALDEKVFRFAAGNEVELWNCDVLRDTTLDHVPLIICEGACDGLAVMQSGFQRVIAVPGWSDANFDADRYEPFKRHEASIKRADQIVVAQHNDNAGAAMLKAIANFFHEARDIRYVRWQEGAGDANDQLKLGSERSVTQCINAAIALDPPGGVISGFSDAPPEPERLIWKMGLPAFDRLIACRSREVSLLTGVPSAGKTTFATFVCHHLVREHGLRIGMGLFETDMAEVMDQLMRLNGVFPGSNEDKRKETLEFLDTHYRLFKMVDEEHETHGMAWLKQMVHRLCARDGCNMVVIDPWNELEHLLEPNETMTQYINLALKRMREWADKFDAHIMIIAHPKKVPDKYIPKGYDVAESAGFFNKPGMGWTVSQTNDGLTELHCWKVRNRQQTGCRPSKGRFRFDEHTMSYSKSYD